MNARHWSGVVLGLAMVCMAPFIAGVQNSPVEEPWPALLASAPVDHDIALLQLRANITLDRLVRESAPQEQGLVTNHQRYAEAVGRF
jgi:hypothetical protein